MTQMTERSASATAVLLLANPAIGGGPMRDLERLRDRLAQRRPDVTVAIAFLEHGEPSFRQAISALVESGCAELLILPLSVPVMPKFPAWLARILARWRATDPRPWPTVRIGQLGMEHPSADGLINGLLETTEAAQPADLVPERGDSDGSLVPAQKRRVLVCAGSPCLAAGASTILAHMRIEQKRLSLRTAGDGALTTKTSCLGPCKLAPVVQVWPEGTIYGGLDEAAVDRIIADHLLEGRVVEDLAYRPTGAKQSLRR